jgi:hypothetical protein
MMYRTLARVSSAVVFGALTAHAAMGQVYINEIFWDAPTNPADATHEYIELRGRPCLSLANHYLIFVEAENNVSNDGGAGLIENIFDLGGATLGANGFLALRQKADPAAIFADYTVNPKATELRNTGTGNGFGSGEGSSIGASNISNAGLSNGQIENGGWTAMLIRVDDPVTNAPALNFDLDLGNDGLDVATGRDGWTVIDSIGVLAEGVEAEFGRVYGKMNFMFDVTLDVPDFDPADHMEAGANVQVIAWPELEAEYVGRWGNSTGSLPEDWHLSNLTEDSRSGFVLPGTGDFRVSAEPHESTDPAEWESSQGVAYGTPLTTTVGSPNYPLNLLTPTPGDFDGDGDVDPSDLVDQWMPRFECGDLTGADFLDWQRNLGTVATPPAARGAIAVVPEPCAGGLVAVVVFGFAALRRPRSRLA